MQPVPPHQRRHAQRSVSEPLVRRIVPVQLTEDVQNLPWHHVRRVKPEWHHLYSRSKRPKTSTTFSLNIQAAPLASSSPVISHLELETCKASVKRESGSAALKTSDSKSHPANFLRWLSSIHILAVGQVPPQKAITKFHCLVNLSTRSYIHDMFHCSGLYIARSLLLFVPFFPYRASSHGTCGMFVITVVHPEC